MLEFSKIEDAARRLKGKIVDNRWHAKPKTWNHLKTLHKQRWIVRPSVLMHLAN